MSFNRSSFGFDDDKRGRSFTSFSSGVGSSLLQSSQKKSSLNDIDAFVAKFSKSSYAYGLRDKYAVPSTAPSGSSQKGGMGRSNVFPDQLGRNQRKRDDFSSSRYPARPSSPIPSGFSSESFDGRRSPNIFQSKNEFFDQRDSSKRKDVEGPASSEGSYRGSQTFERGSRHSDRDEGSYSRKSFPANYPVKSKYDEPFQPPGKLSFDVDREMGPLKRKSSPIGLKESPSKKRRDSPEKIDNRSWASLDKRSSGRWVVSSNPADQSDYRRTQLPPRERQPARSDNQHFPVRSDSYQERDSFSNRSDNYRERPSLDPWKVDSYDRRIVDWADPNLGSVGSRATNEGNYGSGEVWKPGYQQAFPDSRISCDKAVPPLPVPPPPPILPDTGFPIIDYSQPFHSKTSAILPNAPASNVADVLKKISPGHIEGRGYRNVQEVLLAMWTSFC